MSSASCSFSPYFFFDVLVDGFVERQRRDDDLLGLELRVQLLDGGDDLLDLRVAEFEGFGDGVFGDFERAGFHHDDGFFGAGDDDVQQAGLLLGHGGIGHQLAVEQAHANAAMGFSKRQIGAIGGSGSGGHGDHVGIVFAVRGEHHGDDLRFVAPGFGEQRAQRAVDQARSENFAFPRGGLRA